MPTIGFRMPHRLYDAVEELVKAGLFPNASEALREAIRLVIEEARRWDEERAPCAPLR